jgi:hypothetical protein
MNKMNYFSCGLGYPEAILSLPIKVIKLSENIINLVCL